jgi:hypothetical protein
MLNVLSLLFSVDFICTGNFNLVTLVTTRRQNQSSFICRIIFLIWYDIFADCHSIATSEKFA